MNIFLGTEELLNDSFVWCELFFEKFAEFCPSHATLAHTKAVKILPSFPFLFFSLRPHTVSQAEHSEQV